MIITYVIIYFAILAAHWISGVAVNMPPCHGGDRGFDSRLIRHVVQV